MAKATSRKTTTSKTQTPGAKTRRPRGGRRDRAAAGERIRDMATSVVRIVDDRHDPYKASGASEYR